MKAHIEKDGAVLDAEGTAEECAEAIRAFMTAGPPRRARGPLLEPIGPRTDPADIQRAVRERMAPRPLDSGSRWWEGLPDGTIICGTAMCSGCSGDVQCSACRASDAGAAS